MTTGNSIGITSKPLAILLADRGYYITTGNSTGISSHSLLAHSLRCLFPSGLTSHRRKRKRGSLVDGKDNEIIVRTEYYSEFDRNVYREDVCLYQLVALPPNLTS